MGILRDAISSAVSSNQPKTGFNGPQLPFRKSRPSSSYPPHDRKQSSQHAQYPENGYQSYQDDGDQGYNMNSQPPHNNCDQNFDTNSRPLRNDYSQAYSRNASPAYKNDDQNFARNPQPPQDSTRFRPLALPQTSHGEGQPFMRGYSEELRHYNISRDTFFAVVDKINIAIIPNPENQIFQKAANIAGYFIPGSASLGVMAGQFVVGVGTAFGHSSVVSRALASANLEVFLPQGLEICIGSSENVDQEVGFSPSQQSSNTLDQSPESRIAAYGNSLAQITICSPIAVSGGRHDPLAYVGAAIGRQANTKKLERAQKGYAKGKYKRSDKLNKGLQWLIVRKARPESLAQSQSVMKQTDEAARQQASGRYDAQERDVYAPEQQDDARYAAQQQGDARYAQQQIDPRLAQQERYGEKW